MSNIMVSAARNIGVSVARWTGSHACRVWVWLTATYDILVVCYVLLLLYALPLIVILAAFVVSDWFTASSPMIEFSMALAGLYALDVRPTLGTFVVPFVTAYAVAGVQKNDRLEAKTMWLFFTLTLLFLMSIVVYGAIQLRVDQMIGQTSQSKVISTDAKENFLSMSVAYVKELLVYISLVIGISRAGRTGEAK